MNSEEEWDNDGQTGGELSVPEQVALDEASSAVRVASAASAYPSVRMIGGIKVYSTDKLIQNDLTLPDTTWSSYFDSIARRYFYLQPSTEKAQYDHPKPPVFSGSDTIVLDTTVYFLPTGWVKLRNTSTNLPYYLNIESGETSWVHPAPPPDPTNLTPVDDTTLLPTYSKYMDQTKGKPFYVNVETKEGQWNFPDNAYNTGPSMAQQASSAVAQYISGAQASSAVAQTASSAVAQVVSSAVVQKDSSAKQQVASSAIHDRVTAATVSYRYILITIFSPRKPHEIDEEEGIYTQINPSAITGFFLNRTNKPVPWGARAAAFAVDPNTLAAYKDDQGNPILYSGTSSNGSIFNNTYTGKIQPVNNTPVAILIDNGLDSAGRPLPPIQFNSYYFGLANDPNEDILQWTIKGSNDAVSYLMIDDRSSVPQTDLVPDVRNSFIPPIELNISYKNAASSAVRQGVSSAVAQTASSSLSYRASSALAQTASAAQEQSASSALVQSASSAVAQKDSSAVERVASSANRMAASSAKQQSALTDPVARLRALLQLPIESTIRIAIRNESGTIRNPETSPEEVSAARVRIEAKMVELAAHEEKISALCSLILSIDSSYQIPQLQTKVSDIDIERAGFVKKYDKMRKAYIIQDSTGAIVPYPLSISNRAPTNPSVGTQQGGGSVLEELLETDNPVTTPTIPNGSPWLMYYDSMFGKYFYINTETNAFTYDHPNPPVFKTTDLEITDESVKKLPDPAWFKYQSALNNTPYYYNYVSSEVLWHHPAPPYTNDFDATEVNDPTVKSPAFKKYFVKQRPGGPREYTYYVNDSTKEPFWTLPDAGFNPGPSAARAASSALVSAEQAAKSAEERAAAARRPLIESLKNPNATISLTAARSLVANVLTSVDAMMRVGRIYPAVALLVDTIEQLYKSTAYAKAPPPPLQQGVGGDNIYTLIEKLSTKLSDIQSNNADKSASAANAQTAEDGFKSDMTDPSKAENAIRGMVNIVVEHARLLLSMGSFDDALAILEEAINLIGQTSNNNIKTQLTRLTDMKKFINTINPAVKIAAAEELKASAAKEEEKKKKKEEEEQRKLTYGQMGGPMGMPMGTPMGMPMGSYASGQPTIIVVPTGMANGCCSNGVMSCGCNSCKNKMDSKDSKLLEITSKLDRSVNMLNRSVSQTRDKIRGSENNNSGNNNSGNNNSGNNNSGNNNSGNNNSGNNNSGNNGSGNNGSGNNNSGNNGSGNNNSGNNGSGNNGSGNNGSGNDSEEETEEEQEGGQLTDLMGASSGVDITGLLETLNQLTDSIKEMNETTGEIPSVLDTAKEEMIEEVQAIVNNGDGNNGNNSENNNSENNNSENNNSENNNSENNNSENNNSENNNSGNNNSENNNSGNNNSENNNSGNNGSGNNNSGNNNSGNDSGDANEGGGRKRRSSKVKRTTKARRISTKSR